MTSGGKCQKRKEGGQEKKDHLLELGHNNEYKDESQILGFLNT